MLSNQAKSVYGFQSTLGPCQQKGLFKPIPRGQFVQILFVAKNHWITVSNIVSGTLNFLTESVQIYDSGRPSKVSMEVKKQICSFLQPKADRLSFDIINVEGQLNSYDCGVYAIAYATHIIHGLDPVKYKWNTKSMRSHLLKCLMNKKLEPFPAHPVPRKTSKLIRVLDSFPENIYCLCRMPNNQNREMIICDLCSSWYHPQCVLVDQETIDNNEEWFCYKCKDLTEN